MDKAMLRQGATDERAFLPSHISVVILVLAAPATLWSSRFPLPIVLSSLALLIVPFVLRYVSSGRLSRYTALNRPIALLALVLMPLSLLLSPARWTITWPHLVTLTWCLALFFTVVNWHSPVVRYSSRRHSRLGAPTQAYLALGLIVAIVAMLGMRHVDKLFAFGLPNLLVGVLDIGAGLATNEIGGVITLFLPFVAALVLGSWIVGRHWSAISLLALGALLLVTLVLSQSRTALLAVAIGLLVVLLLAGRRTWPLLVTAAVLLVVGLVALWATGWSDRIIFAGAASWQSVVGPRLEIWHQALLGLRDAPLWGVGLGAFGHVAGLLFPLHAGEPLILEDAHNYYLQGALDFGILGGLLVVAIPVIGLIAALRLSRSRARGRLARMWAVGLFASLLAHMLYGLTDAVALGTLAGVPLWFLLGLIMSGTPDERPESEALKRPGVFVTALLALVVVVGAGIWLALPSNRAVSLTAEALLSGSPVSQPTVDRVWGLVDADCRTGWYLGLLHNANADYLARGDAWRGLLSCSGRYLPMMVSLAAGDSALARAATVAQPANATGYFWLAAQLRESAPEEAIELYRRGLVYAPTAGISWQYLGDLLVETDLEGAKLAYLMACRNGDPGANGCLRAAGVAQRQGDTAEAIEYLRLSNWTGAHERANELERQLTGQ